MITYGTISDSERTRIIILIIGGVLILSLFIFSNLAYAQEEAKSELESETGNFVDTILNWIYQSTDEGMKKIEIPENELNFTEEEANQIYDRGKKVTGKGIDFLRETHHLSGDIAQGVLPFEVHPDIIFILGLLVIGVILALRHKTLLKDIGYIALGIIIFAVILMIVQLNLN